jgi:hypothetical protein
MAKVVQVLSNLNKNFFDFAVNFFFKTCCFKGILTLEKVNVASCQVLAESEISCSLKEYEQRTTSHHSGLAGKSRCLGSPGENSGTRPGLGSDPQIRQGGL